MMVLRTPGRATYQEVHALHFCNIFVFVSFIDECSFNNSFSHSALGLDAPMHYEPWEGLIHASHF